jgi:sporulation protein YlmC with PRC-barrel domain
MQGEETAMRKTITATAAAGALLIGATALTGAIGAAEETDTGRAIDGEELADRPTHGMGEGDDALGGGVATHGLEGERGYLGLDDEERENVQVDGADEGDLILLQLLGAVIVDGEGRLIGAVEDLVVDEDDRVRRVVIALTADGATGNAEAGFVLVPLDDLERSAVSAGEALVLTGDVPGDDHQRVERQYERWRPVAS